MTIRKSVLTAIRWTVLARFSGQLFTWAVTIFVIRILSPSDYGLMAMAMVLTSLLFLVNNIGLESVLVQRANIDPPTRARIFGIVIVTNIFCFFLMLLASNPLATYFGEPDLALLVQVLSLQFLVLIFEALPLSYLERELRFKKRSIVEFIAMLIQSMVTLLMALGGWGVWALVWGYLCGITIRIAGLNFIARCLCRPHFSLAGMRELIGFGGFVSLDKSLWFIFAESDKFIGGKMLGKELLGFYAVANHLASLPINKIAGLIASVAFPAFSKVQADMDKVRSYLRKSVRLMSMFAFPVFFGISSVAPTAVSIFLGEKWFGAILPLQILALVMPVRLISTVIPPVLWGTGNPRVSAENFLISAVLMIPAFIFGAQYGPVGLAVAWASAYPLVFLITTFRASRCVQLRTFDFLGDMYKPLLAAAGMYAIILAVKPFIYGNPGSIVFLLQAAFIGAFSYGTILFLIHRDGIVEAMDLLRRDRGSVEDTTA